MYGLPQEGLLSYIALIKHLQLQGYTRAGFTLGLSKHATRDNLLSLVVDDFGVKYSQILCIAFDWYTEEKIPWHQY